jgi:transposase InsO family protein
MSRANPVWGAPRLHGELEKLGIEISQAAVSKYMVRHRKPPSQSWRTFLDNHVHNLVSVDFFTVTTVTFRVLFVFVVLAHDRRRVVHFNVTDSPSARWTAQQMVEAFPWGTAPRYLLRDRDGVYGREFCNRVEHMGIKEVKTAARSPWQNAHCERFVRSIKSECLEKMIFFDERSLLRAAASFVDHYHEERNHQGLDNQLIDPTQDVGHADGEIQCRERLGRILRYYFRQAA